MKLEAAIMNKKEAFYFAHTEEMAGREYQRLPPEYVVAADHVITRIVKAVQENWEKFGHLDVSMEGSPEPEEQPGKSREPDPPVRQRNQVVAVSVRADKKALFKQFPPDVLTIPLKSDVLNFANGWSAHDVEALVQEYYARFVCLSSFKHSISSVFGHLSVSKKVKSAHSMEYIALSVPRDRRISQLNCCFGKHVPRSPIQKSPGFNCKRAMLQVDVLN